MEYLKKDQVLLYEELCAFPPREDDLITTATIRFRDNLKLANHIAKRYLNRVYRSAMIDEDDILQAAYEGLWKSCLSFDESRGYQFSTYAVPMITDYILTELYKVSPLKESRSYKKVTSILRKYSMTLPLSAEEMEYLVTHEDITYEQLSRYFEYSVISEIRNEDGDTITVYDVVADAKSSIYKELSEDELIAAIDTVLEYLKPNHRDLVEEWMYAVMSGSKVTTSGLARKYNLSQPQVSRILSRAIQVVKLNSEEIKKIFGY